MDLKKWEKERLNFCHLIDLCVFNSWWLHKWFFLQFKVWHFSVIGRILTQKNKNLFVFGQGLHFSIKFTYFSFKLNVQHKLHNYTKNTTEMQWFQFNTDFIIHISILNIHVHQNMVMCVRVWMRALLSTSYVHKTIRHVHS